MITAAGIVALKLVEEGDIPRARLFENAAHWRKGLTRADLDTALHAFAEAGHEVGAL